MTPQQLEAVLRDLPDVREVSVVGDATLVATVVSGSFAGQNEAVRQEAVWRLLQDRLEAHDLRSVEFVFTNAPGEDAAE